MPYLLQALYAWSVAALALGVVVGFVTCEAGRPGSLKGWPAPALVLYCIGVAAAVLRWLPGRYGFWLETALLLVAAYVIGCLVGCLLQGFFVARPAPRKVALQTASALVVAGGPKSATPGVAEAVQALAGHAEALAVAAPAALAASSAAQKLLADETPPEVAAPQRQESGLADAVSALAGHAEALAVAAPAALAASDAAQKFLADETRAEIAAPQIAETGLAEGEPPASPPIVMERPERAGDEDNLRLVRGIGEKIERELHDLGVRRFSEIAAWTPEQEQWIAEKLGHCGPIARKFWIAQARLLASGVDTEFSRAVRLGEAREAPLDEAAAAALHAALPAIIAPHANDEIYAGQRPLSLLQPPNGAKDDLSAIEGIDPAVAGRLNALGTWTYAQIARWSDDNARWIGFYLAFPGRVERENWIRQAHALTTGKKARA